MKLQSFFAFSSIFRSSSDLPRVSFKTKSTNINPTIQQIPYIVNVPCKSICSKRMGYIFVDINVDKFNEQHMIAMPYVRIYENYDKLNFIKLSQYGNGFFIFIYLCG